MIKKRNETTDKILIKKLYHYLKSYQYLVLITIISMIIYDVAISSYPYFIKQGIDINIVNKDIDGLIQTFIYIMLIVFSSFFFSILFNYSVKLLGQKVIHNIRMDILNKILLMPTSFFDKSPIGNNLTHLTNDIESVQLFISEGFINITKDILKIIFIIIFMFYLNQQLAFIVFGLVPIFVIIVYSFKFSLRDGYRGVRKASSLMNTTLVESITGKKEIFLFNHSKKTLEELDKSNNLYYKSFLKIIKSYSLFFPVIESVNVFSKLVIILGFHWYFNTENQISIGDVFAFFIYIKMFFDPLKELSEQLNSLQSAMSGAERIFHFLDYENHYIEKNNIDKDLNIKGEITFQNVNFNYNKEEQILKDLSFSIKAGEKVAIVGNTGSGKSTTVSLITRLYEITKGNIFLDNNNIKDINVSQIRKNISFIPQEVFIFTENFKYNIGLDNDVEMRKIKESAEKALIADYIEKDNENYHKNILEEGKSISTGQKQLVAFARAFCKDAPIVILDEATANIDSESEKRIQIALNRLLENKTAIIIAHRLSTIKSVDRILVLHHGKLVEEGNHISLIKNKKGIYYNFYSKQIIQLET